MNETIIKHKHILSFQLSLQNLKFFFNAAKWQWCIAMKGIIIRSIALNSNIPILFLKRGVSDNLTEYFAFWLKYIGG